MSRRHNDDDDVSGSVAGAACSNDGGMEKLLQMFALPTDVTSSSGKDASSKLRLNALLFRGLMEFHIIVVSLSSAVFGLCIKCHLSSFALSSHSMSNACLVIGKGMRRLRMVAG